MTQDNFFITGCDGGTVLHSDDSSNACVMWADRYTRHGDFGGWGFLQLWERGAGQCLEDQLVSTLCMANGDEPQRWDDEQ
jgi:hypothetical protein